jgi:cytoplasmic iron level regulating protein YaaA (DUF328/UPF0246 family)
MISSGVVILLPPSEGKALGGTTKSKWNPQSGVFGKQLAPQRKEIINALQRIHGGSETLLGVKGAHLDRARTANMNLSGAPTLPAWQRYTGVVWDHLDLASLSASQRGRALSSIVVISGLHGIVTAGDLIPDYRLKMGARLPSLGALATWWRKSLTTALSTYSPKGLIIDLLPNEHRSAIDWSSMNNVMRVDLVMKKGGRAGGHNAKAAKGLLARHILTSGSTQAKAQSAISTFLHSEFSAKVAS